MRILALAMVLPLAGCLVSDQAKEDALTDKIQSDNWDADGDGYYSDEFGGPDCDDSNAAVHPDASEICDGFDNDCDNSTTGDNENDADGDGYLACTVTGATVLNDQFLGSGDCNDSDSTIHPDATEVCDDVDNNCDGVADEVDAVDAPSWYTDADGDGYGDDLTAVVDCVQPADTVDEGGDCNDEDIGIHPRATELVGNGVDDDCNGEEDCYVDSDNDGHADESDAIVGSMDATCTGSGVADETVPRDDCNDAVDSIHPGADEYCNGIDDDCDGTTDESDAVDVIAWYADDDNDGFGTGMSAQPSCEPISGRADNDEDCDDEDAAVNPDATEVCDLKDNDCVNGADGDDAADAVLWYEDADGDGEGDGFLSMGPSCTPAISGWVDNTDDCDDTDATIYRDANEICDGLDNDCDGAIPTNESDADGDLYVECTVDSGGWDSATLQINGGGDCDDGDAAVNPAATETCNGADNNCDGDNELNASDGTTFYLDSDSDGHGDTNTALVRCNAPSGYTTEFGDCDDNDPTVNPSATELCDGLDNDCDTIIPEQESDGDNDQYVACTLDANGWDGTAFIPTGYDDCDDSASSVHPGATEACDGVDTDCDGDATEAGLEDDQDGDGYVECSWNPITNINTWLGTTTPTGGDDCNDNDYDINPGVAERCGNSIWDSTDYDCDGELEAGAPQGTTHYEDADGDGLVNPSSTETFCNLPTSGWLVVGALYDCDDNDYAVGLPTAWYSDTDGDGYGEGADITLACTAPSGFVNNRDDCDDSDPYTFPGAGFNEQDPGFCMTDADEDGYGQDDSATAVVGTDCDDSDSTINPDATEISNNSVDEDCDGTAPYSLLAVGLGMNASCAVDDSATNWGVLHCWGADSNHPIVLDASETSSYTDVAVGGADACALDKNGSLTCWGTTTTSGSYATPPPNNVQYQSLSLGVDHGCALTFTSNGFSGYEVDCWGGACSTGECDEPGVGTGTELEWQDVAAGVAVSCGINSLGELDCWGDPQTQVIQDYASLGNTASFSRVALSTGQDVGCVLDDNFGHIECFGDSNTFIYNNNNIPVGGGFTDLSCGIGSCCALDSTSRIKCWGDDSVSIPSEIPSGTVWTAVSVGADMACAIDSSDLLTCWGTICSAFAPACTGHP